MLLYLLRHADADTVAATDEARALSEKGLAQAGRVARFCEAQELIVSLVLTSPVRRAHETAQVVAEHLRADLLIAPWLACGMSPTVALEELQAYRAQGSVMIVGHEPDFGHLAAALLGAGPQARFRVRKASLTLFECESLRAGTAYLQFSIPCRLM